MAVRCVVAVISGGVGLAGPIALATATALTPLLESGLSRIYETLSSRRRDHAAETLLDAADTVGVSTDEEFVQFIDSALSDERRQELLARTLFIAQDAALRDKRRALGRALASGVTNANRFDRELVFIRVLNDLDEPHIDLLRRMQAESLEIFVADIGALGAQATLFEPNPYFPDALVVVTLERLQLVVWTGNEEAVRGVGPVREYKITELGELVLRRLADAESDPSGPDT